MLKNLVGYIRCLRIKGLPGDMMNLGPDVGLIAPAGIIGAFNTPGNVYFVDFFNGDNGNTGTYPDDAWQTIAYALTQCVDDHDDYIIVLDGWNEPTPINIDVTRVHIIGLSSNPARRYVTLTATGDTAIFTIGSACNYAEIAGFELGGGATHGAIEQAVGLGTPMGVYIHDCIFGTANCGDTPQDGIVIIQNATALRVERCKFVGTGGNTGGTITRDGVRLGAGTLLHCEIVYNILQGIPGVAIDVVPATARGILIECNKIACDADTAGAAITLAAGSAGCFVVDNRAMYGDVAGGMVQNPYLDLAAAAANHWSGNMKGAAFIDPA